MSRSWFRQVFGSFIEDEDDFESLALFAVDPTKWPRTLQTFKQVGAVNRLCRDIAGSSESRALGDQECTPTLNQSKNRIATDPDVHIRAFELPRIEDEGRGHQVERIETLPSDLALPEP